MNILLLGGDSDFNLGDAAILAALCHCLSRSGPDIRLSVVGRSERKRGLPGVVAMIPGGPRSLASVFRAARHQQLILVGGGGLFQDDDSRIKMPFWGSKLAALRAVNDNIVGHCLGAGPLRHFESRAFARLACRTMRSVSVRDEFARAALAACTTHPIDIVPDPAFMLPPSPAAHAATALSQAGLDPDRPLIGVALRRWFHQRGGFVPHRVRAWAGIDTGHGDDQMEQLLDSVAGAVRNLARDLDAGVVFLPTYCVQHEGDDVVCQRLSQRLEDTPHALLRLNDPSLYKAIAGQLTLMISARMHPMILAAGMGTPVVGLAYNGKFGGFFEQLGIPPRMLWLDEVIAQSGGERLITLAHEALGDRDQLRQRAAALADIVARRTRALLDIDPFGQAIRAQC